MTDYSISDTIYQLFTTRAFATGIPTVLAGTPVVSAYENDSATQITAGITLGVDHDSVVGMNLLTIVATGANGFEAGKDYNLVITTGTVGGVSVVGEVVGTFSIERASVLRPTTAGNTLDVTATGAAGIDWGNIENKTTVNDLSATDIQLVDTVTTLTNKTGFSLAATGLDAIVSTATGMVEIAIAVWDRVLTGGTHNIVNSSGRRLRILSGSVFTDGTAQSATANSIQLASGDVTIDGQFVKSKVIITGGTGQGQEAIITASVASTDDLTTTPTWVITPDATSDYDVVPGMDHTETSTAGYIGGAVWVDTVNGTAGTGLYVNGTAQNPVDNIDDAKTLAGLLNFEMIQVLPGSSFTFTQAFVNFRFLGEGYAVALGGQDISGSRFNNATISGISTATARPLFRSCLMLSVTLPSCAIIDSAISGTVTLNNDLTSTYRLTTSRFNAGSAVDFTTATNNSVTASSMDGVVDIRNLGNAGTDTLLVTGNFDITLEASCVGGTVDLIGIGNLSDSSTGVTLTQTAYLSRPTISDATLAAGDIDGFSLEEAQKIELAALGGKLSGAATATNTFRAADDSKDRITATVDADGNRSAVTLDGTG